MLQQVNAGKLRAFALAGAHRFSGAPDIPTAAEAGLPGFEAEQWVGMLAPTGTPEAIADRLNHDIVEIVRTDMQQMLRAQGAEAAPGTPAEFASLIADQTVKLNSLMENGRFQIE